MNYIIFDLEWNQSSRKEREEPHLPFEIVEIGAVKLNERREVVDTFERRVRPQVYLSMHRITGELIGLKMEEERVVYDFRKTCLEYADNILVNSPDLLHLEEAGKKLIEKDAIRHLTDMQG